MALSTHSPNRTAIGGGGLTPPPEAASGWQSLGPVLAAADELASYADTDQMLRRAVEMTRERFGLERVGLFLRDPRAERCILRGTWGTSASLQTTDEHAVHHEYDPRDAELLRALQQNGALWRQHDRYPLQCVEDPRRDAEFGRGWLVVTPLLCARELVGVMYNDSALSHAPIDELKQVRTAVFCSHLAALFLHRRSRFDWPVRTAPKSPWVRSVLRTLEENPCSSGATLARELSISPGYLARSFKAEMGVSLVEYRHRRLMARFFQAVERGQANLLGAALEAGFSSYTQFHRVYRKMFGKSPRDDLATRAQRPGGVDLAVP